MSQDKEEPLVNFDSSRTKKRILDLLKDGLPHRKQEVFSCLNDELQPMIRIRNFLSQMRKELHPKGYDIICIIRRCGTYYQLCRLLKPNDE